MNGQLPFQCTQPLHVTNNIRLGAARARRAAVRAGRHESSTATNRATVGHVLNEQQALGDDACHLEQSYLQPSAAPSPQPAIDHQLQQRVPVKTAAVPDAVAGVRAGGADPAVALAPDEDWRFRLRGMYIRNVLPIFRTVRKTEKKLDADLQAVHYAIILMFAVILYDRGWNNLLDRFDQSTLGDICSIMVGLGMVFGVKLMGWRPKDYFNV